MRFIPAQTMGRVVLFLCGRFGGAVNGQLREGNLDTVIAEHHIDATTSIEESSLTSSASTRSRSSS